jgi:hypothetical protein
MSFSSQVLYCTVSTSQYIRQLFSACGFCKTACRGGCELAKPGTGAADRRCMSATRATPRRAYPNVLRPPPLPRSHPAAPPNRAYKLHNTRTASHHTGPPRGEKRHGVVVVASGARIIDEGAGGGGRQRRQPPRANLGARPPRPGRRRRAASADARARPRPRAAPPRHVPGRAR